MTGHFRGLGAAALVVGVLAVLAAAAGRLMAAGWHLIRPNPDKVKIRLRPKRAEVQLISESERAGEPADGETVWSSRLF